MKHGRKEGREEGPNLWSGVKSNPLRLPLREKVVDRGVNLGGAGKGDGSIVQGARRNKVLGKKDEGGLALQLRRGNRTMQLQTERGSRKKPEAYSKFSARR